MPDAHYAVRFRRRITTTSTAVASPASTTIATLAIVVDPPVDDEDPAARAWAGSREGVVAGTDRHHDVAARGPHLGDPGIVDDAAATLADDRGDARPGQVHGGGDVGRDRHVDRLAPGGDAGPGDRDRSALRRHDSVGRVRVVAGICTATCRAPGRGARARPARLSWSTASTVAPHPCDSLSPVWRASQLSHVKVAPSFRICA